MKTIRETVDAVREEVLDLLHDDHDIGSMLSALLTIAVQIAKVTNLSEDRLTEVMRVAFRAVENGTSYASPMEPS